MVNAHYLTPEAAKLSTKAILSFARSWAKLDDDARQKAESLLEDDVYRCLTEGFAR